MEKQKIVNLLNGSQNLQQKKWYVIDSESKGNYSHPNPIIKSIEPSLCDYSDAYILVTGNITIARTIAYASAAAGNDAQRKQPLDAATQVVCNICAPVKNCSTEIYGSLVDEPDFINITMPMYNLIDYSDTYSDTSGSLWDSKRDEKVNNADVTNDDNAHLFKYKANLIGNTETNETKKE